MMSAHSSGHAVIKTPAAFRHPDVIKPPDILRHQMLGPHPPSGRRS